MVLTTNCNHIVILEIAYHNMCNGARLPTTMCVMVHNEKKPSKNTAADSLDGVRSISLLNYGSNVGRSWLQSTRASGRT
jgi:hypothetical protein